MHVVTYLSLMITVRQVLIHQFCILKMKCWFQGERRRSRKEKKYYKYFFLVSQSIETEVISKDFHSNFFIKKHTTNIKTPIVKSALL